MSSVKVLLKPLNCNLQSLKITLANDSSSLQAFAVYRWFAAQAFILIAFSLLYSSVL